MCGQPKPKTITMENSDNRFDHRPRGTNNTTSSPSPLYTELRPTDVLMGRGSGVAAHPGNQKFRVMIREHKSVYLSAPRNQKMSIAAKIMEEIETKHDGRFVEREMNGRFVIVSCKRALEKTSQALRERPSQASGNNSCCSAGTAASPTSFVTGTTDEMDSHGSPKSTSSEPVEVLNFRPLSDMANESGRGRAPRSQYSETKGLRSVPASPPRSMDKPSWLTEKNLQGSVMLGSGSIIFPKATRASSPFTATSYERTSETSISPHPDMNDLDEYAKWGEYVTMDIDTEECTQFSDAAEDEFDTSLLVFYDCLRSNYL